MKTHTTLNGLEASSKLEDFIYTTTAPASKSSTIDILVFHQVMAYLYEMIADRYVIDGDDYQVIFDCLRWADGGDAPEAWYTEIKKAAKELGFNDYPIGIS